MMGVVLCMCPTMFLLAKHSKKQTNALAQTFRIPSISQQAFPPVKSTPLLYSSLGAQALLDMSPLSPGLRHSPAENETPQHTPTPPAGQQHCRCLAKCNQYSYKCHQSVKQKRTEPKDDTRFLLLKAYYNRE